MSYASTEKNNFQYIVAEVAEDAELSRDLLHALLHAEGILARRYFHPGCHRMEPYRSLYPGVGHRLPRTERACADILCLPTGMAVKVEQIRTICALLRFVLQNGVEIRSRYARQLNGDAPPGGHK
jgi:dTDP-4-amino-4,6-dideoxygalactose transaminase